jgi:multiple antibiotic resistance protein
MKDFAHVFALCFMALGPVKTIVVFAELTQDADRRTVVALALRSALVATLLVLFIAFGASGTLVEWRISSDAVAIAGGLVLLSASVRTLARFEVAGPSAKPDRRDMASTTNRSFFGRPVLSPLVTPGIVPPIGVVVILYFARVGLGDRDFQWRFGALLVGIMVANLAAMLFAQRLGRGATRSVLALVGWVFSALQAGLAVQILLDTFAARETPT